jgi:hypothetical protein
MDPRVQRDMASERLSERVGHILLHRSTPPSGYLGPERQNSIGRADIKRHRVIARSLIVLFVLFVAALVFFIAIADSTAPYTYSRP